MRAKIEAPQNSWTGVIQAEPGWRAVLTDGETTYLVPVVGWCWERHSWFDQQDERGGYDLDEVTGEALIIAEDGATVAAASDVASCMGTKEHRWHVETIIAPGKTLADVGHSGWEEFQTKKPA